MKKDKYGTITTPSRKAPYGYGLCEACKRPNIHINERGQLHGHGVLGTPDWCPGSLSAPANAGGKTIFLLITNEAADRQHPIFSERFCFLAKSADEAQKDASKWMRYHGRDARDVLVRIMPPGRAKGDDMHDEWIPR